MPEVVIDGVRYVPAFEQVRSAESLGELFRAARKRRGDSLDKAAAGLGVSKSHLWGIEKASPDISLSIAIRMADYYGLNIEDIAAAVRKE